MKRKIDAPKNPKMGNCGNCQRKLQGRWWIQLGSRVFCEKCYEDKKDTEIKSKR